MDACGYFGIATPQKRCRQTEEVVKTITPVKEKPNDVKKVRARKQLPEAVRNLPEDDPDREHYTQCRIERCAWCRPAWQKHFPDSRIGDASQNRELALLLIVNLYNLISCMRQDNDLELPF